MKTVGNHLLVEMLGCDCRILDDVSAIELAMMRAAQKVGASSTRGSS